MRTPPPIPAFILVEILVALFVLSTMGALPDTVASHFNAAGKPNGFMSQEEYTKFMLLFAVGIPALLVSALSLALRFASGMINIPNRAYWLSDQNRSSTVQFLKGHMAWFGTIISLFTAYVHWLLLKANSFQPPRLPLAPLFIGLGTFVGIELFWGIWLIVRFRRVPKV